MMHRGAVWLSRSLLGAALLAVVIAACGPSRDADVPSDAGVAADLERLLGPWSPTPFPVDGLLVGEADRVCRADPTSLVRDPALQIVAVDARGGGRLTLLYRAPTDLGECYLLIGPDGRMTGNGSGSGGAGATAPNELAMHSASHTGTDGNKPGDTAITGVAGPAIARVRIIRSNGEVIGASVGGEMFTAWWPVFDDRFTIEGIDAGGATVARAADGP